MNITFLLHTSCYTSAIELHIVLLVIQKGISNMPKYSDRLRAERTKKGLTLSELAKELNNVQTKLGTGLNFTGSALSNYEQGLREPKLETWKALSDYFGVDVGYLQGIHEFNSLSYDLSLNDNSLPSDDFNDILTKMSLNESERSRIRLIRILEAVGFNEKQFEKLDQQQLESLAYDIETMLLKIGQSGNKTLTMYEAELSKLNNVMQSE